MEREREMWRGRGGDRGKAGTWEIFFSTSRPREPQREKTYLFFLLSFSKPRRKGNIPAVRNFANILLNASTTGDLAAIAPAVGGALDTLCSRERFTPSQIHLSSHFPFLVELDDDDELELELELL